MVGPLDCAEQLWLTLEFPSYTSSLDELIAGERASGLCGRVGCRVVGHLDDDANTLG